MNRFGSGIDSRPFPVALRGLKTRATVTLVAFLLSVSSSSIATAQVPVLREVVQEATERIFQSAGKQSLEELTAMGGQAAVRDVLEQSAREGGEALVKRVTRYGIEDGPAALRAIGRSPAKMVDALDGLPPELRAAGLRSVERNPEIMTRLVKQYGSGALEVAATRPGVGEQLTQTLGEQGIALGRQLTADQTIVAARYADDIAALPAAEKAGVVNSLLRSPARVLDYLETHPKVLRTAAGVGVVMAIKGDVIGDRGRSVVRPDGTVVTTPAHPGLLERLIPATVRAAPMPFTIIPLTIAGGIAGWFAITLWAKWRMHRHRLPQPRLR